MESVIYKIVNLVNDKFYVGSTTNRKVRFRDHRRKLRLGMHHCKHLQAAWNKYGEEKFDFRVIQVVPEAESLQAAEDVWLQEHVGQPHCYNTGLYSDAPWRGAPKEKHPSFGRTKTEAERQQISVTLKTYYAADPANHPRIGKTHSEETKAQIRAKKLANPSRYWLGKERSEETKRKLSDTQKGRPNPRKGKPMSEQGRANVIASVKRGEESHFYGKRPTNAEDMMKAVRVIQPDGAAQEYPSLSAVRDALGIHLPTIIRSCRSGKPLSRGPRAGWSFVYAPLASTPQAW